MTAAVRLLVNGREYGGWKQVEITAGLDRMARDFTLEVTDRWPGQTSLRPIQPGDICTVFIGDDRIITGYIDGTPLRYDARSVSLSVQGRSRTADLVDCAPLHATGQIKQKTVEQIAHVLAEPYGIPVVADVDTGSIIPTHHINPGETVAESLDRLLQLRQLLATDDAEGRLVLTRAGMKRADTALVVGQNILTASAELDMRDRFSEYRVKGQRSGSDTDHGAAVSAQMGVSTDGAVTRKRVHVETARGQADIAACRRQAEWVAAHRAAQTYKVIYTVQGWRQASGALWEPNRVVRVTDPVIGWDQDMVIGEVVYGLSDSGMTSTLTVAPRAAWSLEPQEDKKPSRPAAPQASGPYHVPVEIKL